MNSFLPLVLVFPIVFGQNEAEDNTLYLWNSSYEVLDRSTNKISRYKVIDTFSNSEIISANVRSDDVDGRYAGDIFVLSKTVGQFTAGFRSRNNTAPTFQYLSSSDIKNFAFEKNAASQSHFRNYSIIDIARSPSYLSDIILYGSSHGLSISRFEFQSLCNQCGENSSFSKSYPKKKSTITISKQGGRIESLAIDNDSETAKVVFSNRPSSLDEGLSVSFDSIRKSRSQSVTRTIKISKQKLNTDRIAVLKTKNELLALIPIGTKLLLRDTDGPIAKSWDGRSFVETKNPQAEHFAMLQKMSNNEKRNQYLWFIFGGTIVIVILSLIARKMYRFKNAAMIACVIVLRGSQANAQSDSPYCGLYCVVAASSVHERTITIEQIRKNEFLSGHPGSTSDNLLNALKIADLHGQVRGFLSLSNLRNSSDPVILHARTPATGQFHHWILFLGFSDYDRVLIYDPPNHRSEISLAELLAVWDGYGIVVSRQPSVVLFSIPFDWILISALVIVLYFFLRKFSSTIFTISLLTVVGGIAWGLSPHGLLRKPYATGIISARYFPQPIRELTFDEFQNARKEGSSVYVDARPFDSFTVTTIPGSINIPINAGLLQLHELTANYSRDTPMIAFCLSKTCGWADAVANQLHHLGFRNVSIYRGGVSDWIQHKQPVEK